MIWIIIAALLVIVVCWFLLSPLELQIDTRIPQASVQWIGIGKAVLVYEKEEWWLKVRVLFFYKKWSLLKIIFAERKKKKRARPVQRKKTTAKSKRLPKFFHLLKTFRVMQWKIAMDTGDSVKNAWLYPLNFSPYTWQHVHINFMDENYLVLTIRNVPWRLAYAWMK